MNAGNPSDKRSKAQRRHLRIERGESAIAEQRPEHRLGEQDQRERSWHRNEQAETQTPVDRCGEPVRVVGRMLARQMRQDHGAQRDAEDAERKFEQAIGVVQPGHTASDQERGDQGVDQQVDLRHRRAEQRRDHQLQDLAHAAVVPAPARPRQQIRGASDPAIASATAARRR
jgi:hypothetical protein